MVRSKSPWLEVKENDNRITIPFLFGRWVSVGWSSSLGLSIFRQSLLIRNLVRQKCIENE